MTGARTTTKAAQSPAGDPGSAIMKVMATDGKAIGRRFKVLLEWDADEQVWVTYVPTLGQLSTYGNTRDEALEQTREAIVGYLEAAVKEGIPLPRHDARTEVVDLEVAAP